MSRSRKARATIRSQVITCSDHEARNFNLADDKLSDIAFDAGEAVRFWEPILGRPSPVRITSSEPA